MRVPMPARFVLSALALAAAPVLAQADTVIATHTAYMSNLRVELIDLDPTDGITPTFSYDMHMFGSDGSDNLMPTVLKRPEDLLASEPFSFISEDGSRQMFLGPDSIRTTTQVTLAQAVEGRTFAETGEQTATIRSGLRPRMQALSLASGVTSMENLAMPGITVSAQTRVVITGDAGYSRELGSTALTEWLATSGYDSFNFRESGPFSGVIAQFRREGETPGEWYEGDPETFTLTSMDDVPLSVSETTGGGIGATASGSFAITFDNASGQTTTGLLLMSVVNDPSLELVLQRSTLPTPVPEPGSWALMGLGLALGAVAMRKRRPAGER